MPSRSEIVLTAVLHILRPLARTLLRHGVAYPAFSAALKQVFLQAAAEELAASGKKQSDSALSLLSGVHRRDVRNLGRLGDSGRSFESAPMNMASEVVARWISEAEFVDEEGAPRALARTDAEGSFDALVAAISLDVRPRAVLDELVRLGIAQEDAGEVRLLAPGFVPRQGFEEMVALMKANLHDHAAAAAANLEGENFLEQAMFVDELTEASARHLHSISARAWRQAFKAAMREAQARFEHDRDHAPAAARTFRVRFGSYFHIANDNPPPPS